MEKNQRSKLPSRPHHHWQGLQSPGGGGGQR
jgi:hypothetical protein